MILLCARLLHVLLEVGIDDLEHYLQVLLSLLQRWFFDDVISQVSLNHSGHQAVDGAPNRCDLLQDGNAIAFLGKLLFQGGRLTLNASYAGQQLGFVSNGVGPFVFMLQR